MTNRRTFIGFVAAGLLAVPPHGMAQTAGKVYRIGFFSLRAGPTAADEAFVLGMRELGYTIGRDLLIEYRWANNDMARLQPIAEELVRLKVDVIVTAAEAAVRAAVRATTTIPIVIAAASDPVGAGLVASLARPGGNVTGMTLLSTELARKRLQLIHELVPGATRVAVLVRGTSALLIKETQAAGQQLGVTILSRSIDRAEELPEAFAQYQRERAQALIVQVNPLNFEHRRKIAELAARQRLPAIYEIRNFVDDGGLVSYGPDLQESYRRAAGYVDRILKGAKPSDLAIEQPDKYEMVLNLKTAKALGLTIPQSLLLRANVVIE